MPGLRGEVHLMRLRRTSLLRRLLDRNYDVMVRYVPAARRIRAADPDRRWTVLDIGSGATGIAPFLPGWRHVGVDRTRPDGPAPAVPFCQASALSLPFADGSWDAVTCIDVLEHLAPEDRARAVQEAVRVARRLVIIACPCGDRARAADEAMSRAYLGTGQEPPPWLVEHLRHPHPDAATLERIVRAEAGKREAVSYEVSFNESLGLQRIHRFLGRTSRVGYKVFSLLCTGLLPLLTHPLGNEGAYRCFIVTTFSENRLGAGARS